MEDAMFTDGLMIQFKLLKHLKARDHRRVADYVGYAMERYTTHTNPVDSGVWQRAKDFLKESGYTPAVVNGRVWLKTPDGRFIETNRSA